MICAVHGIRVVYRSIIHMSSLPQDVSEYDQQLGLNIIRARSKRGISRIALSNISGIELQIIEDYEAGRRQVSAEALIRIGRSLEVPISVLFDGIDTVRPEVGVASLREHAIESDLPGTTDDTLTGERIEATINLIRQQLGPKVANRITDLILKTSQT